MRMILIYSIKPKLKPLAFVRDKSDVEGLIESKRELASARSRKIDAQGGSMGPDSWASTKWIEVEVDLD